MRDDGEVNIRDLIKQTRKNNVFDYKSLIYETSLKVSIMFKHDKHLQTESALTPLCCITPGGSGQQLLDRAQCDT